MGNNVQALPVGQDLETVLTGPSQELRLGESSGHPFRNYWGRINGKILPYCSGGR